MTCPRCGGRTRKRRIKSVQVDRCPACGGTWFAAGKLQLLKNRERAGDYCWIDIDLWRDRRQFRAGRQQRLVCPRDGRPMITVRYGTSRVRVDICSACRGIWLDRAEYDKIVAYLEKRVNTETVQGYLRDLEEEFVEFFTGRKGLTAELAGLTKVLHLLELRFTVQHPRIASTLRSASRGVPGV